MRQSEAVPVHGCLLVETVLYEHSQPVALTDADLRAGNGSVVTPHLRLRVMRSDERYIVGRGDELMFGRCRGGVARQARQCRRCADGSADGKERSEEHTSELQSLMRSSYAVSCLKKKIYNHSDAYN